MTQYVCSVCGYVHDEDKDGLFQQLPPAWVCPLCKASKSAFSTPTQTSAPTPIDTSGVSLEQNPPH